jgi:phosphoglycerate dehydrogenase-like enzyme
MTDVLVLRPQADFARVDALPPASLSVSYHAPDGAEVPELMRKVPALVIPAVGPKLPASLFEGTALKLVQVTGAGLDRLDKAALTKAGIPVANVPGGSNSALAEYTVSTASIMLRRLGWADAELKAGNYAAFRTRLVGGNLAGIDGLLIGIVGLGIIGLAVAQAFVKAGCRVCYYDPAPSDPKAAAALGAEALPLAELLRRADIVTLHVPLLPATQGLIGSAELASMKKDAILIQASRGGIVDEKALADSLRAGHLGGAVVDVFSTEPPAPDNPLFTLEGDAARRLLLTPHIAGVTRQSAAFLFRTAWQNVERVVIAGQAPLHRAY